MDETASSLPSFPKRFIQTFFAPGELVAELARKPAWALALVVGIVLIVAPMLLIPADVWDAMMRETLMRQGREVPEGMNMGSGLVRALALGSGAIGYCIMAFLLSGLVTLLLAFIMGDEGRYRQYLAVLTHAWLIPAVVGFALLPLKISQQSPQMTLNLGTFLFFLPEGYFLKLATMLDLSQIWAWLVVAQGAHAIDDRRSFGSAAVILLGMFFVITAIFATFLPMPG